MSVLSLSDLKGLYGELKDEAPSQARFREFIGQEKWQLSNFRSWLDEAVREKLALEFQDLVLALGGKLGFEPDFGHYRSTKNGVSYDGIWRTPNEPHIIVETKLATWVRTEVDQLGNYIEQYAKEKAISMDEVCGLYVVGDDTKIKALADQVRGSRYSHEIRVIYYKDLLTLAQLKEKVQLAPVQIAKLLAPIDVIDLGELVSVLKDIVEGVSLPGTEAPPGPLPLQEFPVVHRKELGKLEDGEVIICPSRPPGVDFLRRFNAWGFIRVARQPRYLALYVSRPHSELQYLGEIDSYLDPRDPTSPVRDPDKYDTFEEGKKLVMLRKDSVKKLADPLKLKSAFPPVGPRYTTLSRIISARLLDDILEES